MRKLALASAIVLCGACAPALAQTTETRPPPGERDEGARPSPQPSVPREDNPNAVGDDKVNGLEVPRMKDPREGGRNE